MLGLCKYCKKSFEKLRVNSTVCSDETCREENNKAIKRAYFSRHHPELEEQVRSGRDCDICGKPLSISQIRRHAKRHSGQCSRIYSNNYSCKQRTGKDRSITRFCGWCNVVFLSPSPDGCHRYCCKEHAYKKRLKETQECRKNKRGASRRVCSICGGPLPKGARFSCSDHCFRKYRKFTKWLRRSGLTELPSTHFSCRMCGKIKKKYPRGVSAFCCAACGLHWGFLKHHRKWDGFGEPPVVLKRGETFVCAVCEGVFPKCRTSQIYCSSSKCKDEGSRRRRIGRRRQCVVCEKHFLYSSKEPSRKVCRKDPKCAETLRRRTQSDCNARHYRQRVARRQAAELSSLKEPLMEKTA